MSYSCFSVDWLVVSFFRMNKLSYYSHLSRIQRSNLESDNCRLVSVFNISRIILIFNGDSATVGTDRKLRLKFYFSTISIFSQMKFIWSCCNYFQMALVSMNLIYSVCQANLEKNELSTTKVYHDYPKYFLKFYERNSFNELPYDATNIFIPHSSL